MNKQRYHAALQLDSEVDMSQDYGRRLIVNVVDERAKKEPNKLFAQIPHPSGLEEGFVGITYERLANAVNRASWWLFESMGQARAPIVFAYIGPNDLCYPILLMGAMKCGYQMMMPSPRNSIDYQEELFLQAGCQTFYCSANMMTRLSPLAEKLDLIGDIAPGLWELLDTAPVRAFPCSQTFEEVKRMPFMILHTSGSTGPPKPITFTHECTTTEDTHRLLSDPDGRLWWRLFANKRYFTGMPCFHSAGIWFALFLPVYFDSVIILGPGHRPVTSSAVISIFQRDLKLDGAILPPSILADMSNDKEIEKALKGVSFLAYGGGPLPPPAGDKLSNLVILHNFIGFTEASAPPRYVMTDPEDWNYFQFHPASGFRPELLHDDYYRLVFHRRPEHESCQSVFRLFPELEEYAPGDVLTSHPSKRDLWTHKGRTDDLIVLKTGEKFNPVPMELHLAACPHVKDVLVAGDGQSYATLLVERHSDTETTAEASQGSDEELIRLLWPYVQKENEVAATQARITRDHIFILPPSKTFLRSPKGTVQRKMTLSSLEGELKQVASAVRPGGSDPLIPRRESLSADSAKSYGSSDDLSSPEQIQDDDNASVSTTLSVDIIPDGKEAPLTYGDLLQSVRQTVRSVFNQRSGIEDDTDLLNLGLDSIQALYLSNELRVLTAGWPQDQSVALEKIYSQPTIRGLVAILESSPQKAEISAVDFPAADGDEKKLHFLTEAETLTRPSLSTDPESAIEELIHKYTDDLKTQTPLTDQRWTVAVTGASGSIGRQIVTALIASNMVKKVYCLNRKPGSINGTGGKLEHVQIELSQKHLGIEPEQYTDMQNQVDVIIHTAWLLDFLQPLKSFESSHLAGLRHLIDLALGGTRKTRIMFLSSIASVLGWTAADTPIPDDVPDPSSLTWSNGYGQSKYIAERILQQTSEKTGLPVTILRLGQVSGATTDCTEGGRWSTSDWLPQIVLTSQALGAVPLKLGAAESVDWIPVDKVAVTVLDLTLNDSHTSDGFQLYNIANPRATQWSSLLPAVCHRLQEAGASNCVLKLVTFEQWLGLLKSKAQDSKTRVADFPAIRLLGWLQKLASSPPLPVLALEKASGISPTLSGLRSIDGMNMERWMEDWGL